METSENKKKFITRIYMKSGNVIEIVTSEFSLTPKLDGQVQKLSWANAGDTKLVHVDVREIEAVTYEEVK